MSVPLPYALRARFQRMWRPRPIEFADFGLV